MTNPLDESRPPRWGGDWGEIRALVLAWNNERGWYVDLDLDGDREPGENPRDVRFVILAGPSGESCFQVNVPVDVLRTLAQRIGEL